MRPTPPDHRSIPTPTAGEPATGPDTGPADRTTLDQRVEAAAARRTATSVAHLRDLHRAPTRSRRGAAVAATGLALATALALVPAGPAGATTVGDEAAIRAAFADPNETLVTLTTHIDLVDCLAGDLERTSATPLTIEANGFRLRQTCAGERILHLDGGGGVTVDHLHMTGGDAVGTGGGAINSDGPVIVRNGSELSGNAAPIGGAITSHGPNATITVLDSLIAVNTSVANGGALFSDAPIELRGSTFADNDSGSHGGVASASTIVVSGSTFQGNRADAGGAFQAFGSLTVDSSSFTGNQARETHGGAFYLVDATATITASTFDVNDAAEHGGAIAGIEDGDSSLTILGSTFQDNTAVEGGAIYGVGTTTVSASRLERNESTNLSGGAIFNDGTLLVDQGSVLTHNVSDQSGGAITADGPITVSASQVTANTATAVGGGIAAYDEVTVADGSLVADNVAGQGGGIYADGAVRVADSALRANVATSDEGGGIRTGGGASIARSTLAENAAGDSGGAIFAFDVPVTVDSSTFVANTAGSQGGAITSLDATTLTNSTLIRNQAGVVGGAIETDGDLTLTHVTAVANVAPSGANVAMLVPGSTFTPFATVLGLTATDDCRLVGTTVASAGSNRSADDTCDLTDPTDVMDAGDPELAALAADGGTTETMRPDETSPLVDAIPLEACDPAVATDQRGALRPQGTGCDIGAVEVAGAADPTLPGDDPTDPTGPSDDAADPADPATPDAAEVLSAAATGLDATTGVLPITGSGQQTVLGALGAALVVTGALAVRLAARRRR